MTLDRDDVAALPAGERYQRLWHELRCLVAEDDRWMLTDLDCAVGDRLGEVEAAAGGEVRRLRSALHAVTAAAQVGLG